jgi:hypothetical protein
LQVLSQFYESIAQTNPHVNKLNKHLPDISETGYIKAEEKAGLCLP